MPSRNAVTIHAARDAVWSTLMDPYAYEYWVVGSRRVRDVDESWPDVGARFHHSVGAPRPAPTIDDTTKIIERVDGEKLVLEVRFRPLGVGIVELRVRDGDTPASTVVEMREHPTRGPAAAVPDPIAAAALHARNAGSLWRLRRLVERRFPAPSRG